MIAREGIPFILIGLLVTVVSLWAATRWSSHWLFGVAVTFGALTVFVTYFFRDPERSFVPQPGLLVSPADGKVLKVEYIPTHPFIGEPTAKISVFLSVFDVHVNRVPADGVVDYVKYNPGAFAVAFVDKASDANEQTEIGMTTASGSRIVFKQIAGFIARRIVCRLMDHDTVKAGERFGMIRFGSRAELFVPATATVLVKAGDRVYGGRSGLALIGEPAQKPQLHQQTGSYDD